VDRAATSAPYSSTNVIPSKGRWPLTDVEVDAGNREALRSRNSSATRQIAGSVFVPVVAARAGLNGLFGGRGAFE
jgi:hypothetical protein